MKKIYSFLMTFLSFGLFSAQTYNVTFQLNTASITSGGGSIATSMYVGGGVVGDAMALQLTDPDGDGVWTGTVAFPAAGGQFTFLNSPTHGGDWGTKENIAGLPCAVQPYSDRELSALTSDTTVLACFGTCDSDGTCASFASPIDVDFAVDMSQVSFTYNNVFVQGSWDGWAAGVQLADPDGDNIYEGTVPVAANLAGADIEFKFNTDNWANMEWGDANVLENSVCSNGNAQYTNRVYTVPSTGTGNYGPVCWESCTACQVVNALTMTAVMDMTIPVKAVMVTANQSISDLSTYQLLNYNNGSTTAGSSPYTFPAISMSVGEHFVVCKDSAAFISYFGSCMSVFDHIAESAWPGYFNGDDAIELHNNGSVIETFGVVGVDGSGESWEYMDTWAWKDTAAANVGNWTYGAVNCADGSTTTQTSSCPFPLCGGSPPPSSYNVTLTVNATGITVGPNGMYAGGGFLGGSDGLQLTDSDGDGTWEGVATVFAGTGPNYYAFFNSPSHGADWGTKENLAGLPCGMAANYNDRVLPSITSDTTIQHCYGNCASDGTCNSAIVYHNVTLSVNTANITVGPNGMYAGGGVLGDAVAVPLSDPDGDGTWTGVASLADGASGNYIFLNSPANGGDWGTKENLAGLPCSDPANYNDRILAPVTGDTTLLHCFGTCDTDGTCPLPPANINYTFQLDMNQSGYSSSAVPHLRGSWNWGAATTDDPMTDTDGDGVWEITKSFTSSVEYLFAVDTNGVGGWDVNESNDPTEPCTNGNAQYTNRVLVVASADTTLGVVCLGSCSPCPTVDPCLQSVPFDEPFSASLPNCWTMSGGENWLFNTSGPNHVGNAGTLSGSTTSGGHYAVVDASGHSGDAILSSPNVDISTLTNPELSFFLISDNEGTPYNSTLTVMVNGDTAASYTGNTNGWTAKFISLSAYTSPVQIDFIFSEPTTSSAFYDDIAIDDVSVHEAPSCPQPSGLVASNVTADSVDLSWTAGGTETQWLVYLVDAGTLATTTPVSVSSTNVQLAVNSSTTYAAYVQAVCGPGDSSLVTGPLTFTTQVAPGTCGIFTVELTDSYGDGWNGNGLEVVINGTPTDTLTVATGTFASFQIAVNIGDVMDLNYLNTGTWGGENGWNVIDNNGNTIVSVAPTNSSGSAGAGPANTVGITACPACSAPTGVMASNITTNSADVSWTASGSETEWWFVLDGVGQSVTSTTNALTGLSPATVYTVEIAAICGAGDTSSLTLPYTFATACSVASAPYLENFDAGFSPCWTQDTADVFDWTLDANGTPSGGTGPSDDVTGGGNYMFTEASVPRAYGDSAILISEDIDISSLTNPELSFFSHMFGSAMGTLRVDMHDGAGYSTIFTKSGDQGDVWVEENVLLSTTASVVNFKIVAVLDSNSGGQSWPGDMAIDNFGVVEAAANDLAIVDASVPSACDFDSTQYVSITVVNQGLVIENTFDASYSLNGAAAVTETNSIPLNPGDTLVFPFFTGVDMSLDGVYSFDFNITSAVDTDPSNNNLSASGENFYTPGAPSASGDTICDGDTATVMAMSADGPITWYDAMTGGNVVGSGDNLSVAPTATTSYYAEAKVAAGFSDDFESYNPGDYIAQSDTVNWATWPGGTLGGQYDAPISNAQAASGSNSLHLDNAASNIPDPVLPFGGQTWTSGSFEFSTNLYVETTAYFNLQGSANIGTVWAMEMTFTGAGGLTDPFTYDLGGGAITGTYPGTGVWFNVTLKCADLTTGTWELFIDGVSKGTATLPNGTAVGGCNLYAAAGNNYYIDDISWSAVAADACTGARTEAVVTVNDCSNITELTKGNMEVYPNPNNGEFVITTSNEVMNVTITDVRGKVVYTNNTVNNNTINVNLSDLEKGMYMINVETANGTMTENVIVQ